VNFLPFYKRGNLGAIKGINVCLNRPGQTRFNFSLLYMIYIFISRVFFSKNKLFFLLYNVDLIIGKSLNFKFQEENLLPVLNGTIPKFQEENLFGSI